VTEEKNAGRRAGGVYITIQNHNTVTKLARETRKGGAVDTRGNTSQKRLLGGLLCVKIAGSHSEKEYASEGRLKILPCIWGKSGQETF